MKYHKFCERMYIINKNKMDFKTQILLCIREGVSCPSLMNFWEKKKKNSSQKSVVILLYFSAAEYHLLWHCIKNSYFLNAEQPF